MLLGVGDGVALDVLERALDVIQSRAAIAPAARHSDTPNSWLRPLRSRLPLKVAGTKPRSSKGHIICAARDLARNKPMFGSLHLTSSIASAAA